ncbi:hypothetical protein EDEG_03970 [Edhazardia aedis USNM 41457]|uniref:P-type ATPase A domain-containing protein n=1 Tax=Edhazardia aedis (strain USNM 41457) TaxID=1003232 RepID=J8ZNY3_EDHAE|nr:hypothetical protein EDEG_03970 [Edhazardia aedis USNM 41457]|eukprot:EJW01403.2 hypothetical protein EDEG_03970 [Edhazardia aedis USNM 41457]
MIDHSNEMNKSYMKIEGRRLRFAPVIYQMFRYLSLGIYDILTKKLTKFKIYFETKPENIKSAPLLKVTNEYGISVLVKVECLYIPFHSKRLKKFVKNKRLVYFECNYTRFFYDNVLDRFVVPNFESEYEFGNLSCEEIIRLKGRNYSSLHQNQIKLFMSKNAGVFSNVDANNVNLILENQELLENFILFGENSTNPFLKSKVEIFADHLLSPLVLYMFFSILVWLGMKYWHYAMINLFFIVYSLYSDIKDDLKSNSQKRQLATISHKALCFRNKKWVEIDTKYIFPGDLVDINVCSEFFADVKLLNSEVVVDESFLTGETVPVFKKAKSSNSIIFSGTKILKSFNKKLEEIYDIEDTKKIERIRLKNIFKKKRNLDNALQDKIERCESRADNKNKIDYKGGNRFDKSIKNEKNERIERTRKCDKSDKTKNTQEKNIEEKNLEEKNTILDRNIEEKNVNVKNSILDRNIEEKKNLNDKNLEEKNLNDKNLEEKNFNVKNLEEKNFLLNKNLEEKNVYDKNSILDKNLEEKNFLLNKNVQEINYNHKNNIIDKNLEEKNFLLNKNVQEINYNHKNNIIDKNLQEKIFLPSKNVQEINYNHKDNIKYKNLREKNVQESNIYDNSNNVDKKNIDVDRISTPSPLDMKNSNTNQNKKIDIDLNEDISDNTNISLSNVNQNIIKSTEINSETNEVQNMKNQSNDITNNNIGINNKNIEIKNDQNINISINTNDNNLDNVPVTPTAINVNTNKNAIGMVVSIGFSTAKGKLVKNIMTPKPINFVFYKQTMTSMKYILFFGLLCSTLSFMRSLKLHISRNWSVMYAVDLVLCLLSPELITSIWFGSRIATKRLRADNIICYDPVKIDEVGVTDIIVFDKTGTLTEDGLDLHCVDDIDNEFVNLFDIGYLTREGLGCCHAVHKIDGELLGDPLDIKMFKFSSAILVKSGDKRCVFVDKFPLNNNSVEDIQSDDEKLSRESESNKDRSFSDETANYNEIGADSVSNRSDKKTKHAKNEYKGDSNIENIDVTIKTNSTDNNDIDIINLDDKEEVEVVRIFDFDPKLRRMSVLVKSIKQINQYSASDVDDIFNITNKNDKNNDNSNKNDNNSNFIDSNKNNNYNNLDSNKNRYNSNFIDSNKNYDNSNNNNNLDSNKNRYNSNFIDSNKNYDNSNNNNNLDSNNNSNYYNNNLDSNNNNNDDNNNNLDSNNNNNNDNNNNNNDDNNNNNSVFEIGVKNEKLDNGNQDINYIKNFNINNNQEKNSSNNNSITNKYYYRVFTKGSPESIHKLLKEVPEDYDEIVKDYALDGFRIIALAYKETKHTEETITRENAEKDLTFLCFIVFANKLKPQTIPAIKELNNAKLQMKMATGDNILTSIFVARQSKMINKRTPVIFPVLDDNAQSVYDCEWLCLGDEALIFDKTKLTIHKGDNKTSCSQFFVACEGHVYEYFRDENSEYFEFLMEKCVVFARMSPDQKKMLMEDLAELSLKTAFCGDGANDCGALTSAHVGIALADNEASMASNFTCTNKDISSVVTLLKEGRASLTTSLYRFMFVSIISYVQFSSLFILSFFQYFLSDAMTIHTDLGIVLPLSIIMTLIKPNTSLHNKKPDCKLFSKKHFLLTFTQIFINTFFFALITIFFKCNDKFLLKILPSTDENDPFFKESNFGTAIFITSSFQILTLGWVFTKGNPHRLNKTKNKVYIQIFSLLLCTNLFVLLFVLDKFSFLGALRKYYRIVPINFTLFSSLCGLILFNSALIWFVSTFFDTKSVSKMYVAEDNTSISVDSVP